MKNSATGTVAIPVSPFPSLQNGLAGVLRNLEHGADVIHGLPDRAVAWLRMVPHRLRRFVVTRALPWLERKGVTARAKLFVPLFFSGWILLICTAEIPVTSYNYIFVDGKDLYTIQDTPDFDYESNSVTIRQDTSARDAQMILTEGQKVRVSCGDQVLTVTSRHETVDNLLRRLHIDVNDRQMVVLDSSGKIPTVSVVYKFVQTRNVVIPTTHKTERRPNPMLDKGTEQVVQEGVDGDIIATYDDTYRYGELFSTELVHETNDTAITEIQEYGTMVDEVSRDDRIDSVYYNDDGSGYLLFRSGDTMSFRSRITCSASAYSIGHRTASGRPTKVGNIAVDPTVFPYGTRFYIYTNDGYLVYGNAVAADCGTSIKGHKIDLWFETYREACRFGRRDCTVFVLN